MNEFCSSPEEVGPTTDADRREWLPSLDASESGTVSRTAGLHAATLWEVLDHPAAVGLKGL